MVMGVVAPSVYGFASKTHIKLWILRFQILHKNHRSAPTIHIKIWSMAPQHTQLSIRVHLSQVRIMGPPMDEAHVKITQNHFFPF